MTYEWHDPWEMIETARRLDIASQDRLEEARYLDDRLYQVLHRQSEAHYLHTRNLEMERQVMKEAIARMMSTMRPAPFLMKEPGQ